ncbi:MAG: hypothetical protein ABSD02_10410 [Steroidobacteraceae bacterium]|jgi:hypothetical protein
MNTQITQKLAALGMALLMNGAIVGTVAYLFSAQMASAESLAAPMATV